MNLSLVMFSCLSSSAFVLVIILTSMMVIIVFLVNILIAQLSTTYEAQKENALLEFDIDKALFVTRLENSRFKFWVISCFDALSIMPISLNTLTGNTKRVRDS